MPRQNNTNMAGQNSTLPFNFPAFSSSNLSTNPTIPSTQSTGRIMPSKPKVSSRAAASTTPKGRSYHNLDTCSRSPTPSCPRATARDHRRALRPALLPDEPPREATRGRRHPRVHTRRAKNLRPRQPHYPRLPGQGPAVQQGRARVLEVGHQGSPANPPPAQGLQLGQGPQRPRPRHLQDCRL